MNAEVRRGFILGAATVLVSMLLTVAATVAVFSSADEDVDPALLSPRVATPTPCQNFGDATPFLAGIDLQVLGLILGDQNRNITGRLTQLQSLFDRCVASSR